MCLTKTTDTERMIESICDSVSAAIRYDTGKSFDTHKHWHQMGTFKTMSGHVPN